MDLSCVPGLQAKFLSKIESKLGASKSVTPALLKKIMGYFDTDQDGWLNMRQFLQGAAAARTQDCTSA